MVGNCGSWLSVKSTGNDGRKIGKCLESDMRKMTKAERVGRAAWIGYLVALLLAGLAAVWAENHNLKNVCL